MYAFFFFKHMMADEVLCTDWSSEVCASDLRGRMIAIARGPDRVYLSVRKTHFRVVTPFSCFARFVSTRVPTLFFCIAGSKSGGRPVPRHTFLVRAAHP